MPKNRVYLATWLAHVDKKIDYGIIIAPKKPVSPKVLGYVFNHSYSSATEKTDIRNYRLATAVLFCKVQANSQREVDLREFLSELFYRQDRTPSGNSIATLEKAYLFEKGFNPIKSTTVNGTIEAVQRSTANYGILELVEGHSLKQLRLHSEHADQPLPLWYPDGKPVPVEEREIPAFTFKPPASKSGSRR
ncbi:hypothetical protein NMY22_g7751 [Coprinellus aureogranulatus]|nr:hypothetical protein NMY22_g7751 [Coprinellus aureogranulatus]